MSPSRVAQPEILIVDDQRANLFALRSLLAGCNAQVIEADSGNEALCHTLDHDFALALVDVNMPHMDGYEVVELLRGSPRTRNIPVIFLTAAYTDEAHRLRGYQVGAVDYIEKPIQPLILHTKVRIFLDLYTHRQQLQQATIALAEQALRESEHNFRVAMSVGQTVAFRIDRDFRCSWAHSGQIASNLAPQVGMTLDAMFESATAARLFEIYHRVWASGRRERSDVTVRRLGEIEDRYVDLLVEPVFTGQNRVEALACAAYEITDRVRAQRATERAKAEAERANEAKTRFLAAASHDLRQPVQGLRLLMHLLQTKVTEPSLQKVVSTMGQVLESTERMLGKFMEFAALECGRMTVSRQVFRLDSLVRRIVDEAAPEAAQKSLRLKARLSPCDADSDPVLVERIIRNLISNALRYTSKGGVLVGLRFRKERVIVVVYDTGCGIPADMQSEIFEEFRQLANPERDRNKGLGLGLAIAARTAELLGHHLDVRSVEGRGSVFTLEMPRLSQKSPVAESNTFAPMTICTTAGCRILVIEDDPLQAMGLTLLLTEAGFSVTSVLDTARALLAINQIVPDLILSDYRLPEGMTGLTLIRTLRQSLGRIIPAVVVTGDTQANIAEQTRQSQCAIVHKPYSPQQLLSIINDMLTSKTPPPSQTKPGEDIHRQRP